MRNSWCIETGVDRGSTFPSPTKCGGGDREDRANAFTADDLVAVESLSVQVPPEAAYKLLHGSIGEELGGLLSQVPTDVDLGSPEAHTHLGGGSAADRAWVSLKAQPGIGWVTAGKLLARKRPRLLPVYDDVVRCVLGEPKGVWLALDGALADSDVRKQVATLLVCDPIAHIHGQPPDGVESFCGLVGPSAIPTVDHPPAYAGNGLFPVSDWAIYVRVPAASYPPHHAAELTFG